MAYTQLSPGGIPGKRYNFTAKSSAAGKDIGPFTALSVLGVPGEIKSFTAKTPATGTSKGVGPFTALSVLGVPGEIKSFTAKTEAEVVLVEGGGGGKVKAYNLRKLKLDKDDQDILEFLMSFVINEGLDKWDH